MPSWHENPENGIQDSGKKMSNRVLLVIQKIGSTRKFKEIGHFGKHKTLRKFAGTNKVYKTGESGKTGHFKNGGVPGNSQIERNKK